MASPWNASVLLRRRGQIVPRNEDERPEMNEHSRWRVCLLFENMRGDLTLILDHLHVMVIALSVVHTRLSQAHERRKHLKVKSKCA
jgi:galactose-1-phosphate uridylyltransferase